jgi:hypothetical protein
LNSWRQLGGKLEGGGEFNVNRVPPIALHDIAYATDWLVVDVGGGDATNRPNETVAIPFNASKKDAFVTALNSAIKARPQVGAVLIVTNTGEDYGAIAETAGQIDAFVFYLEGGWAAWTAHRQMMEAAQHSRTVVSESRSTTDGRVVTKPGGCGGCPH